MNAETKAWREALETLAEGRYLEAHQGFEDLWHEATGPRRDFYQGWVLLAASLFHRDRGNAKGCRLCFERAHSHWQGLGAEVREGLDLDAVLAAVAAVLPTDWARPDLGALTGKAESAGKCLRERTP